MQLRQAVQAAAAQLEASEVEAARLSAEVLAFAVLGCDRAYLFAHPERELTDDEQARYQALVERRATHEPLQYLTGWQEFWRMDFAVTPAVLIPRPETEVLVEAALEVARRMIAERVCASHVCQTQADTGHPKTNRGVKIIDVGTGSGAIAVALAKELPEAEVHAVDISAAALEVARQNAERLGARVQFAESDVMAGVERDASFDLVVSNPPYVGWNEADKLQRVVKDYEPHLALFAGDEGLTVIKRLIPQAHEALRAGGWLLMEIGWSQSEAVMSLLTGWEEVHAVADLAGIPRVIAARRSPN